MTNSISVSDVSINDVVSEAIVLQTYFNESDAKIGFINRAISDFRNHKMVSDPSIDLFFVYINGSMSSSEFVLLWSQYVQKDQVASAFVNRLSMAIVFQVDDNGEVLNSEDLK